MTLPDLPPTERPARLRVGVVGAGRVGSVLGAALAGAGHEVVAVSAVSEDSLRRAAELLPGIPVRPVPDVVEAADLVLLAVPDDALVDLIAGLSATGTWRPGQLAAHTSGLHGLDVFAPALDVPVIPLALHPAMTFTGTGGDLQRVVECCFGITAPPELRPIAEALVLEIGAEPVWIDGMHRPDYHLALAHGANHLTTLIAQSLEVLADLGVEHPERLLGPLVHAALDNTLRMGDAALTGPVARGDVGTVAMHVARAAAHSPDLRATYLALARATAERAERSGRLRADRARPILDFLDEEQGDSSE